MMSWAKFKNLFQQQDKPKVDNEIELDPSNMSGRIFDLNKKRLLECVGFKLYVMPNDYIGGNIIVTKEYEPHVTKWLTEAIKPDSVVIDIGANLGYFSCLAASIATNGKVICFEPNNQNLQLIYASVLENKFSNIKIYPYAASDCETFFKFNNIGSNGLIVGGRDKEIQCNSIIQSIVPDDVLKDEIKIDVVKIDVEGHEPFVVNGMKKLITKHNPTIFMEYFPYLLAQSGGDTRSYLDFLADQQYAFSIIRSDGDLVSVSSVDNLIEHWKSLGDSMIHLDVLARPHGIVVD